MERTANDGFGAGGAGQSGTGNETFGGTTGGFGASSGGVGGTQGSDFGSAGGTGGATSGADQAAGRFNKGKDAVSEKLGQAREKAGELKMTLADKLEAGAEKLRQRGQSGLYAGAGAGGTVATDARMAELGGTLADGLQGTADFLRDGDLKESVEKQVKEHPGRTLLIALGVGYVLGKAFRK